MSNSIKEQKKNQFNEYLKQSNTNHTLNQIFLNMFQLPSFPENPMEFIQKQLIQKDEIYPPDIIASIEAYEKENESLIHQITKLKEEQKVLQQSCGYRI